MRGTLLPLSLSPFLEDSQRIFGVRINRHVCVCVDTQRCCSPVWDKLQLRESAACLRNGAPPGVVSGSTPFETDCMRQTSGSWQRAAPDKLHFDKRQLLRWPWPCACRRGGCTPRAHVTTSPGWTISPWSAKGTAGAIRILHSSFHCMALNTFTWHAWARTHTHTPRTTRSTSGSGQGVLQSWPDVDRGTDRGPRPSRFYQNFL